MPTICGVLFSNAVIAALFETAAVVFGKYHYLTITTCFHLNNLFQGLLWTTPTKCHHFNRNPVFLVLNAATNSNTPDGLVPVLVDVALAHLLLRLLSLPGTVESWAPSLCQGRQLPDSWRSPAPQTSSIIFRNPEAVRIAMDSPPLPCWSYLMTQNFNGCKRHFPRPSPRVYGFLFKLIREFQVPNT